jgi:hypothetical protein
VSTFSQGVPRSALELRSFSVCAALAFLLTFQVPARAGYLPLSNCDLSSHAVVQLQTPLFCASAAPASSVETDAAGLPRSPLVPVGPAASRSSRTCGVGASNPTARPRRSGPSAEAVLGDGWLADLHGVHLTRPPRQVAGLFLSRDSVFRPPRMPG